MRFAAGGGADSRVATAGTGHRRGPAGHWRRSLGGKRRPSKLTAATAIRVRLSVLHGVPSLFMIEPVCGVRAKSCPHRHI